jgi:hypothetical protein
VNRSTESGGLLSPIARWLRNMRLRGWPLDGPPPPVASAPESPKRVRSKARRPKRARPGSQPRAERLAPGHPVPHPGVLGLGGAARPPVPEWIRGLPTAAAKYDALTTHMLEVHGLRVKRWRSGTTGVAYELRTAGRRGTPDRIERWIEAPRPKGPVSCAVFLHEVGHHAIGLGAVSPRCLEEYHAWRWATEGLAAAGIPVGPSVERRMREGLEYAVAKALRRGLRRLPSELTPYLPPRRRVGAR